METAIPDSQTIIFQRKYCFAPSTFKLGLQQAQNSGERMYKHCVGAIIWKYGWTTCLLEIGMYNLQVKTMQCICETF